MRQVKLAAVIGGVAALGLMASGAATGRAGPLDPLAFQPLAASFPSTPGTYTIDTSGPTPTLTGPSGSGISLSGVLSPDGSTAVFDFGSINIGAGELILASGSRPVALLAQQGMIVGGTIDGSGALSTYNNPFISTGAAGPGGGNGGGATAGSGPGGGPGGGGVGGSFSDLAAKVAGIGGGGGGGFGGAGGNGGTAFIPGGPVIYPIVSGGPGGGPYGSLWNVLQGGSGGAAGIGLRPLPGGGGGGAIELGAVNSITINGTIGVNGGNAAGSGGFFGLGGGGGGGSGGGILIDAPTVTLTGTLSAAGGEGTSGGLFFAGPEFAISFGAGGGGGGGIVTVALPEGGVFLDQGGTIDVAGGAGASAGGPGVFSVAVVPEPSGLVMAGIGLLGTLGYRRYAGRRAAA
jgi:hypothetical protein